jgi:hypothetical protein
MQLMGLEAVHPKPRLSQPGEGQRRFCFHQSGNEDDRLNA